MSQRELAAAAGMTQSAVARAERGSGSHENMERLLEAVGIEIALREPPVAEPSGQDVAHRAGIAALRRLFVRHGFRVATEQLIVEGRFRGWIDLMALDEEAARLVLVEFKSSVDDLGGTERQVERYARGVLGPARALGWRPKEIVVALVVLATDEADLFVTANRVELAASFPSRGRAAVRAMLDRGPIEGRILLAFDPFGRGRRALMAFRVDGRRRPLPFARASDVRRAIDERRRLRTPSRWGASAARPTGRSPGHCPAD
jgi:transcriptional regulator with XRE-family HTH domain